MEYVLTMYVSVTADDELEASSFGLQLADDLEQRFPQPEPATDEPWVRQVSVVRVD